MTAYTIREEFNPDFSNYFDCDLYSKAAGDYCFTVFGVTGDYGRFSSDLNADDFKAITGELDNIMNDIDDVGYYYNSVKEVMADYGITYSPKKAHMLKELANISDSVKQLCVYLTVKTGRPWTTRAARGYSQGDYADMIYCSDFYTEHDIDIVADLYMGCAKEFSITDSDNDTVYGYFVADCQAHTNNDYKTIVCNMADLDPDNVIMELIDDVKTITVPSYRIA